MVVAAQACSVEDSAHRPVGILAAAFALGIALGAGWTAQLYAAKEARLRASAVAAAGGTIKSQTLVLQRAAFANPHLLPMYGSSELYCCGDPYRPTQLFASRPSGFDAFAIGRPGVGNLLFMETFGALGHALEGKKLVIVDSPPWFIQRQDETARAYASNFSREIADTFVFEAPLSLRLRSAGARRMLAHPDTLDGDTLLRLGVHALARPTPLRLAAYAALVPLGRVEAWVDACTDAARTILYLRREGPPRAVAPSRPAALDWDALAGRATTIAERRDTTNPFGFPDDVYEQMRRDRRLARKIDAALAVYRSGDTNRDGRLYAPESTDWADRVSHSPQWTDLRLAAAVLRELGARPFIWTMPMPGFYQDYTPLSAPLRRTYYERWEHVVGRTRFPWLDFRAADEDPYFLTDTGGHLSPRGWIFADRALAMFWHDRPIQEIRASLADLAAHAPAPPTVVAAMPRDRGPGGDR